MLRFIVALTLTLTLNAFARSAPASGGGVVNGDSEQATADNQPPRALDERGLANLTAFARLFGYVRHFHPTEQVAAANWNEVALTGVRAVESARDADELALALQAFFEPLAPTVRVFVAGGNPPAPSELAWADLTQEQELVRWRNAGFGTGAERSIYTSELESQRRPGHDFADGWRKPEDVFSADLGGGVACRVPLTLFKQRAGAAAPSLAKYALPAGFKPVPADRSTRLAAIVIAWNVFQHFYPYFDVVQTDWPAELERGLKRAATDADEVAFLDTLRRLVAALHDGHGYVKHACDQRWGMPPFTWCWAEGQLVITSVTEEAPAGLARGDVVLAIDGVPTAQAFERAAETISAATPQNLRYRALQELARGTSGQMRRYEVRAADGAPRTVEVELVRPAVWLQEPKPEQIAELESGVWYVDIGRIKDADLDAALDDLAAAEGIVFDLRGYPSGLGPYSIGHLLDETVHCARWRVPQVRVPDRAGLEFSESNWNVAPRKPRFEAKVAFVVDGRAISYAETYMGIIEHYKLAAIVGEATAGTNGNINPFELPGGYAVSWTGMQVLKHDGSQHHGIGIQPTIPAARTIAGIAAGRDELLERALEAVRP